MYSYFDSELFFIVRSLLEQKFDPNVANSDGLTALHQVL